jgi:7,8-dihydropterin-6-yl-methyl-4-(beta-D-ribofuranosyl)aminobenzene 5'-phosphate synthase
MGNVGGACRSGRIWAIVRSVKFGGLHFPITGDRAGLAPLNMQQLLGSSAPPWRPLKPEAVDHTIRYLQDKGIDLLSPSAHDSCDWSLERFARAFGDRYRPLKVGEEIRVP